MKNKLITYALVLCFTSEVNALTESQILKKCSDSPNYIKRSNASVKKLEVRLKKYKAGSPPALAIEDQIVQGRPKSTSKRLKSRDHFIFFPRSRNYRKQNYLF